MQTLPAALDVDLRLPPLFLATLISEELGDFTRKLKKKIQSIHLIIK